MSKILAYPLSVLYILCFGLLLLFFHPIQWFCLNVFGYEAHKQSVSLLNLGIMRCTHILGTTYRYDPLPKMPECGPLIIVTNHQSMYDIPPLIWYMRNYHPKFVSKKELGRGIPSVSYNLRHGGSALIDRRDRRQARDELRKLGEYIEKTGRSAVIFPEGTRSRTGVPKPFHKFGLAVLMASAPNAQLLPITINNSWKLFRYGKFPYGLGARVRFTVHPPIPVAGFDNDRIPELEEIIASKIEFSG